MRKLFGASQVLVCICEDTITDGQILAIITCLEEEGYEFILLESGIKRFPEIEELLSLRTPLLKFKIEQSLNNYIRNKISDMFTNKNKPSKIVLICKKAL